MVSTPIDEDFARGFKYDYQIHQNLIEDLFNVSISYGLLNYDQNYVPHSPLFIVYIVFFKQISFTKLITKLHWWK